MYVVVVVVCMSAVCWMWCSRLIVVQRESSKETQRLLWCSRLIVVVQQAIVGWERPRDPDTLQNTQNQQMLKFQQNTESVESH